MSNPNSTSPDTLINDTQADIALLGDSIQLVQPPSDAEIEHELMQPYAKFRTEPLNALQELGLHVLGTAWRSYDRIIGQEIFYSGFSENMKEMVLKQQLLRGKVRELACKRVETEIHLGALGRKGLEGEDAGSVKRREERRREIEGQLMGVADEWTDNMICKMEGRRFIRGAYYLTTQLLTRAYHQGIHVNSKEVLALREVAKVCEKKKQSIIFLPCHRSHVDYVSLQLVCYRLGLALPTVVAGDNLNFPLVGSFLQHAGAMWIRRSFGDDQLYTILVQSYIDTLLQNGYNFECFVEGGRSRTGKLLQPKFGILSFLLDSILSGRVEDAMICPVSTQYDKVIEVESYISELLGKPKKKEDLTQFLSASNVLSLKLGRVDVRFHKPWSLRDFIADQRPRLEKRVLDSGDATNAGIDAGLRRRLLGVLGYTVLNEINAVSVIMPTALVGTVLLTLSGRSIGRGELMRRVKQLALRVQAAGGRLAHFSSSAVENVVDRALEVLGPKLVGKVDETPEEMYYAEDRFNLSFYRNMTIHLFITQALVCAGMYTKVKIGGGPETEVLTYKELHGYVSFLSQLFRTEFIFPATPFDQNLQDTLNNLVEDGILTVTQNETSGAIETVSIHPDERAQDMETFDFYNFLIWPFIEASWLGNLAVFMLCPPAARMGEEAWIDMKVFADKAQLLGKTLYHRGDLSYYEAVNKETLKNAIARTEEEKIIIVTKPSKDSKTPQRVRINPELMPKRDKKGDLIPEGRLWALCEHINKSRRDAPGMKVGEQARRRILGLASAIGEEMFDFAVSKGDEEVVVQRKQVQSMPRKVRFTGGGDKARL